MRDKLKRIWRVYYDSYAFHVFMLSLIVIPPLGAIYSEEFAIEIAHTLQALSTALFISHLPHLVGDIDIPRWYSVIVNGYVAVLMAVYVSGLDSYLTFSLGIFPVVMVPITLLSVYVVLRDDDFDIEEDWG